MIDDRTEVAIFSAPHAFEARVAKSRGPAKKMYLKFSSHLLLGRNQIVPRERALVNCLPHNTLTNSLSAVLNLLNSSLYGARLTLYTEKND